MKQNIKSIGEIELDEKELKEVAFHYIKEDRKLIFLAIQKYLKSLHNFELKKLATSNDKDGGMVAKCAVESLKAEASSTLFISKPIVDRSDRKEQAGGHGKPNQGFYTILMKVLQEGKKKEPLDARKVYDEMLFELPNLAWRNFTIYVSDKRRQASSGYVYDGKKKLIHAKK